MNVSVAAYSCADGTGLSTNSVTPEYWDNKDTEYEAPALVSASVTLCFILFGAPANLLIIVSILWQHLYRQPTYILLLNLAIADLLMCAVILPFTVISGFAGGFRFGSTDVIRCKLCQLGILFTLSTLFTIHIIAFLSIDRLLFIKYAIKYNQIATGRRYTLACCLLWLLCFILSSLPLFGVGDITFGIQVSACFASFLGRTKLTNNINYAIFVAAEVLVPLSVIILTNIWILCIIQGQMRKIYIWRRESHHSRVNFRKNIRKKMSKHSQHLKLVKVFGAIWIANMITWIPPLCRVFGTFLFGNDVFNNWWFLFMFISLISFAILHPTIEAALIPELRKMLVSLIKKVLCFRKRRLCASKHSDNEDSSFCEGRHHLECLDYCNASVLPISAESELE